MKTKILIFAVMLIAWTENLNGDLGSRYTFVEAFAGEGNCTKAATWGGYVCAALDITYIKRFRSWWEGRLRNRAGKTNKSDDGASGSANPFDIMTHQGLASSP